MRGHREVRGRGGGGVGTLLIHNIKPLVIGFRNWRWKVKFEEDKIRCFFENQRVSAVVVAVVLSWAVIWKFGN